MALVISSGEGRIAAGEKRPSDDGRRGTGRTQSRAEATRPVLPAPVCVVWLHRLTLINWLSLICPCLFSRGAAP